VQRIARHASSWVPSQGCVAEVADSLHQCLRHGHLTKRPRSRGGGRLQRLLSRVSETGRWIALSTRSGSPRPSAIRRPNFSGDTVSMCERATMRLQPGISFSCATSSFRGDAAYAKMVDLGQRRISPCAYVVSVFYVIGGWPSSFTPTLLFPWFVVLAM
jgi:hypothetical protein